MVLKRLNTSEAYQFLYDNLKHLGAIKWHNNRVSYYMKFKDCRIGSIRISNHNQRNKYNYTFTIDKQDSMFSCEELEKLIDNIHNKVLKLKDFNPSVCLVYKNGKYTKIKDNEFRKFILKGGRL